MQILMMKRLFKQFLKYLCLLCTISLFSCSIYHYRNRGLSNSSFMVHKVRKMKNNVYIVYATRNDSVFKIISYYDGNKSNCQKRLRRGMLFHTSIQSIFGEFEKEHNMIPPCNEAIEYHGVTIAKEEDKGIFDVWYAAELNGPYINEKAQ